MPNAWSSSSRIRQAVAIHKEREDVLVNSSSILSKRERGKVMDIAVVGSAALLRLKRPTPLGNGTNKSHKIALLLHYCQESNDNESDERTS